MTDVEAFHTVRDGLLAGRTHLGWPELTHFNWALDHFDAIGGDRRALWIVEEDGSEDRRTFAELAERSNRVANHLRELGVRRGDRVLLMLGNVVPLWETMLAAMKLGAVIIPATTLLGPDDLVDRVERGDVRPSWPPASGASVRRRCPGADPRRRRRRRPDGWHAFGDADGADVGFTPDGPTRPTTRCCSTSPPARPRSRSWWCTPTQSYPVGHLSTMYWIGLQPGDVHLNISSPGWAKHAWSCFFAPWNAGATVFIYNYARFDAPGAARHAGPVRRHDLLRAADGVAHADPGGPDADGTCRCASWSARASRSTPRSSSR